MIILITGATGNVGRYVAEELLKKKMDIRVAGTNTERLDALFDEHIAKVYLDFERPETFQVALEGVDRIFLIRPPHMGHAEALYPFIDFAKKSSVSFITFLSLMGIENNPFPPHHRIEKYIEASGIAYSFIRPGFFMQNLSGIHALEICEKNEVFIPAGRSRTSFIDASDIGLVVAQVLAEPEAHKNCSYTITGREALNYYEIAEQLTEILHRNIDYKKPSMLTYRTYFIKDRKMDKEYVTVTMLLYLMTRLGTAKSVTDTFFKITGREPKTFRQFVEENRECFERHQAIV